MGWKVLVWSADTLCSAWRVGWSIQRTTIITSVKQSSAYLYGLFIWLGDKALPNNYRPISLTLVIGTLIGTVIRDKSVSFLEENILIKNTKYALCYILPFQTNLLDFYNDLINNYDETKSVDIIYLSFKKAFDKVPHKQLVKKLESHGIVWKFSK